ncbi:GxxExxY protein [Danxiaibacter flavus]|uniref:GxxExxY protein n=1 Tax=Danxiaibacter flavus TaxID=3049108 RepID=A0ABV3Z8R7_9BACT|nr:GxxExxY protein [Chitinophagaceae bacterium DXS]
MTKTTLKQIVYEVNGAAIEVHKALGPGLLESVYHSCMAEELSTRNISFISEMIVPVHYKGLKIDTDLKADMFVEDCLVLEFKAVEKIIPVYEAQIMTYMRLLRSPMGLLINFNCHNIYREGQKTYVNEFYQQLA